MSAWEQQSLHGDLSSCEMCGPPHPLSFTESSGSSPNNEDFMAETKKLQRISDSQLNVLYEVSKYQAGMSSTFL